MYEQLTRRPELFRLTTLQELALYQGLDIRTQEDETSVLLQALEGNRAWLHIRLRDRKFDGTSVPQGPLSSDWQYDKEIDIPPPHAVEQSIYWGDPSCPLEGQYPTPVAKFIHNPFEAIPVNGNPGDYAVYAQMFHAVFGEPAPPRPGQMCVTSPKPYKMLQPQIEEISREAGYTTLSAMPSWYHVAKMFEEFSFDYITEEDRSAMAELDSRVAYLDRTHASWLVTLQFFNATVEQSGEMPEHYVGNEFVLRNEHGGIITFPLSYDRSLWMNKPL